MNNFGVIEIATAKTTSAPGWAYVPDTRELLPGANALPANRKRARNGTLGGGVSAGDLSARQEAKIQKDIQALDRDVGKESTIPVPARGGRAQNKHTPGVRKILQSQKTFANHLDDFAAMQNQAETVSGANASSKRPARRDRPSTATATPSTTAAAAAGGGGGGGSSGAGGAGVGSGAGGTRQEDDDADVGLVLEGAVTLAPHPGDGNPLLMSRVPEMPSEEELRTLLAHAPLSYEEARARWEGGRPVRAFCEVCGYWGRVKCIKCGTRVCALECLETHREECITRYGL